MTCYLDYTKMGKLEVLEGTFISTNTKDKSDCGSGKVYLERVPTSDFKTEDFLLKKKDDTGKLNGKMSFPPNTSAKAAAESLAHRNTRRPVILPPVVSGDKKDNLALKPSPQIKPNNTQQPLPPVVKKPDTKTVTAKPKPSTKKEDHPVLTQKPAEKTQEQPQTVNPQKKDMEVSMPQSQTQLQITQVPRMLVERENNLVKTITTSEENIQIDFYDNGEIDNDTITVYHNNKLVVSHARLTLSPITIKIKCSKTDNHHEIVMVAENLGIYPPNTAMMVVRPGNGRMEVFMSSDEKKNAKVIINYVPKE
jgi:hypothetical protein